jgi:hypothetical protein
MPLVALSFVTGGPACADEPSLVMLQTARLPFCFAGATTADTG